MNWNKFNFQQLKDYFTLMLPKKLGGISLSLSYPLIYGESATEFDKLKEHAKGYQALYFYLQEDNLGQKTDNLNFNGLTLNIHLVNSLNYHCPSAYAILLAEVVRKITPKVCGLNSKDIDISIKLIDEAITKFGALGHYFGVRLALQLGHFHYSQLNEKNYSFYCSDKSMHKLQAEHWYQQSTRYYECFSASINNSQHRNIFENAFIGRDYKEVFQEDIQCSFENFYFYLSKYFLALQENFVELNNFPLSKSR